MEILLFRIEARAALVPADASSPEIAEALCALADDFVDGPTFLGYRGWPAFADWARREAHFSELYDCLRFPYLRILGQTVFSAAISTLLSIAKMLGARLAPLQLALKGQVPSAVLLCDVALSAGTAAGGEPVPFAAARAARFSNAHRWTMFVRGTHARDAIRAELAAIFAHVVASPYIAGFAAAALFSEDPQAAYVATWPQLILLHGNKTYAALDAEIARGAGPATPVQLHPLAAVPRFVLDLMAAAILDGAFCFGGLSDAQLVLYAASARPTAIAAGARVADIADQQLFYWRDAASRAWHLPTP